MLQTVDDGGLVCDVHGSLRACVRVFVCVCVRLFLGASVVFVPCLYMRVCAVFSFTSLASDEHKQQGFAALRLALPRLLVFAFIFSSLWFVDWQSSRFLVFFQAANAAWYMHVG